MTTLHFQLEEIATPLGQMLVIIDEQQRLRALDWQEFQDTLYRLLGRQYKGDVIKIDKATKSSKITAAIQAYFEGDLHALDQIEVVLGGTDFQRQVWSALREIQVGETWSYKELAERIGRPAAVRAVGTTNGANPISLVLPCHRVIGANGALIGYGGGLSRKQWLLSHEKQA